MTKLKFARLLVLYLFANSILAQNIKQIQNSNFNDQQWQQLGDKVQLKFVCGEQEMLPIFKTDKEAKVPLHQHLNEQTSYMTERSVEVRLQDRDYVVNAQELNIVPDNIPHQFDDLEAITVDLFLPPDKDGMKVGGSYFENRIRKSNKIEVVAAMDIRPGDVAVSAEGRVFATIHPLGSQKIQLVEIVNGKAVPYPSNYYQKNGEKANDFKFDAMLGLIFDKNNQLWVIDMGLELGKTRLWAFDISKNEVIQKIELPSSVAPKGTFAQDVVIDEKNRFAFLADISNPGIITVNLKTKKVRRFSGHFSLQAENKDMIIKDIVTHFGGKPARIAIDPITLSNDRETLFFGAMNGNSWYKMPAKLLREGESDIIIGNSIEKVGDKPFSDGAMTDADGNHYFTNLQEHAITKLDVTGKLTNIIQDNEKLLWPDNVYQGPDDWMYISVNQLDSAPAFTGIGDQGIPPYYIYRFKK